MRREDEEILGSQIPEYNEGARMPQVETPSVESEMPVVNEPADEVVINDNNEQQIEAPRKVNAATEMLGQKLSMFDSKISQEKTNEIVKERNLTKVGESITQKADFREGWIDVDKALLGERAQYYPEDWRFRIRPATVEAIRNWSTIDDENANSIDDVFNEILKSCLAIVTPNGPLPWGNVRSWDRLFFILLIREYTFINGEVKIQYTEDCPNCDNPVQFNLTSQSLMYDMPDPDVMKYFSQEEQTWLINPQEYDVDYPNYITLYLPTLEKEANIKAWLINKLQQNRNAKVDNVFIRFLVWMAPKISKDNTIAQRQIRDYEREFKSWDTEMFAFMDDVLKNITVTPSQKLITACPVCGEEVTSDIRFPDGIRSLFAMGHKARKFGKK